MNVHVQYCTVRFPLERNHHTYSRTFRRNTVGLLLLIIVDMINERKWFSCTRACHFDQLLIFLVDSGLVNVKLYARTPIKKIISTCKNERYSTPYWNNARTGTVLGTIRMCPSLPPKKRRQLYCSRRFRPDF